MITLSLVLLAAILLAIGAGVAGSVSLAESFRLRDDIATAPN